MSIEQRVIETIKALPPDKQQEVLDFAEFLQSKRNDKIAATQSRRSLKGIWADSGVDVTAEDIDHVRREMWQNFPREDF